MTETATCELQPSRFSAREVMLGQFLESKLTCARKRCARHRLRRRWLSSRALPCCRETRGLISLREFSTHDGFSGSARHRNFARVPEWPSEKSERSWHSKRFSKARTMGM